ncbi:unnamed protein product [Gadus morhua 'NCC']
MRDGRTAGPRGPWTPIQSSSTSGDLQSRNNMFSNRLTHGFLSSRSHWPWGPGSGRKGPCGGPSRPWVPTAITGPPLYHPLRVGRGRVIHVDIPSREVSTQYMTSAAYDEPLKLDRTGDGGLHEDTYFLGRSPAENRVILNQLCPTT